MRVFDFDQAIVRQPGHSVIRGLRSNAGAEPDYGNILQEHAAYVAALRGAGLDVEILPPLEDFPDSIFVEDPALVLPEGAIVLRPGAPSRMGEAAELRGALARRFGCVLELADDEYADGGDVLMTPGAVFIGLSRRTTRRGAQALQKHLAHFGRKTRIVETPPATLHFKTGVSLIGEDTVLARQMPDGEILAGLRALLVPEGEEPASNALRINETVFLADGFPKTRDLVTNAGFEVRTLAVTEIAKLDAGLSCMSLRWRSTPSPTSRGRGLA